MTAKELSESLGGRPMADGFQARCPAHDDRDPSLSIRESGRFNPLIYCQAGCSQEAVIEKLTGLGLWTSQAAWRETSRYVVKDISGRHVVTHVRLEAGDKKRFVWEQPNGAKGLAGTSACYLPLYRSEDLANLGPERVVYLTEGEKACDAMRAQGFTAVASVTGASTHPCRKSLSILSGRKVCLWPDHDVVGYRHMRAIGEELLIGIAKSVRVIVANPGTEDGYDAADHLDANGLDATGQYTAGRNVRSATWSEFLELVDAKENPLAHALKRIAGDTQSDVSGLRAIAAEALRHAK